MSACSFIVEPPFGAARRGVGLSAKRLGLRPEGVLERPTLRHVIRCLVTGVMVGGTLVAAAPGLAGAFGKKDVGTSGAAFLKIGPGARPVGMGEAFTGVADDVHSIYWNPAGLATLKKPELTGMHMQWFQEVSYEFAAFAYPTENAGTWGLALTNLHVPNIERRTEDTDSPIGEFESSDNAYWLSYANRLTRRFSVGANAKYIRQVLDSETANAYAMDVGALYEADWRRSRLGVSVQNVGTKVKFVNEADPLPLTVRLGGSFQPVRDRLTLSSDLIAPRDHQIGLAVGGEYAQKVREGISFAVRTGYRTDSDVDGLKGIAAGGGLTFGRASFDFAWVPFGELGNSYRYAIHLKF